MELVDTLRIQLDSIRASRETALSDARARVDQALRERDAKLATLAADETRIEARLARRDELAALSHGDLVELVMRLEAGEPGEVVRPVLDGTHTTFGQAEPDLDMFAATYTPVWEDEPTDREIVDLLHGWRKPSQKLPNGLRLVTPLAPAPDDHPPLAGRVTTPAPAPRKGKVTRPPSRKPSRVVVEAPVPRLHPSVIKAMGLAYMRGGMTMRALYEAVNPPFGWDHFRHLVYRSKQFCCKGTRQNAVWHVIRARKSA